MLSCDVGGGVERNWGVRERIGGRWVGRGGKNRVENRKHSKMV